jgi:phosphatidylserine decarboxylase
MNSPATPIPGDVLTPVPSQGTSEITPKPGGEFSAPTPSSGKFNPRSFVRKLSGLTGSGSSVSSPTIGSQATLGAPPLSSKDSAGGRQRKLFGRNKSSTSGYSSSSGASSGGENAIPSASTPTTPSIASGVRADKRADSYYEYKKEHDIIGIVMLEVQGADNLPKWANSESRILCGICPCLP